jgi:hypothetical protein
MVRSFFKPLLFTYIIVLVLCNIQVKAQNNGLLQNNDLVDTYRIGQLTNTLTNLKSNFKNRSFIIRPIDTSFDLTNKSNWITVGNLNYTLSSNDKFPVGYNNESLIPSTGIQSRYSLGIKAKIGRLVINIQPEFINADNKVQSEIDPSFNEGNFFSRYYYMNVNVIDYTTRFGTKRFQKAFLGQSSIKYHFNHFTAGISSENLWWGPGINNALVLTNNAPGFLHFTLNTRKPLATNIGTFESQMIYGILDSSGIEPIENIRQQNYWPGAYVPKVTTVKRNLAGLILTWQPKWVNNLFIGLANMNYFYAKPAKEDPNLFYPYSSTPQTKKFAALGSVFVRYAMPAEKAEVYLEIGRADKFATVFNLMGDTIPLGYTAGFRKLFTLKNKQSFIELSAEITHLQLPDPRLIFTPENPFSIPKTRSWYTNSRIRQGYTHNGQQLGAGIGPGSNSQRLNISWLNGFNKLGIHGERVIHNNDFYYYQYLSGNLGYSVGNKYWVDLTYGFHAQAKWRNFMLAGLYDFTTALNYKWVKVDGEYDGPSMLSDMKNKRATISMIYFINQAFKVKLRAK